MQLPTGLFTGTFSLYPGKTVGLMGENGVGKSSLIRAIKEHFLLECPRPSLGFLEQPPLRSVRNLSAQLIFEQLISSGEGATWKPKAIAIWQELVSELKWEAIQKIDFELLSGGQKQILKWMLLELQNADFYFIDEPFQQLDSAKVEWVTNRMQLMAQVSGGILLVDHQRTRLEKVCDEIWVLSMSGENTLELSK